MKIKVEKVASFNSLLKADAMASDGRAVPLTVSHGGQPQVLHAVFDQLGQLLALGAPVEVVSLLRYALCPAPWLVALPAQPPRPLHALLPQQGVVRLVTGGGVPLSLFFPGVSSLTELLALVHVDRHLRL